MDRQTMNRAMQRLQGVQCQVLCLCCGVPGPAVVGLPTSEALKPVTVNASTSANKETDRQVITKPKKANPPKHKPQ